MSQQIKSQQEILDKLSIPSLNDMQRESLKIIQQNADVILLSPTGTGKTLAFLLPIIATLDVNCREVQALILAPSRELAIQIEQVIREMGTGYKANVIYGGRPIAKDKMDLRHPPAILVGTPGRIADHMRRRTFSTLQIRQIVLDEFDKSLEIGFEEDMEEIILALPNINKRILTSATKGIQIPDFVGLRQPVYIDYLYEKISELTIKTIISPSKDKLETLLKTLCHLGNQPGIIFCNYKESIQRVSAFLSREKINHECFHGGLEQKDRERALIKFRNGTHRLLLATDLAARGIDVPEIKFIIHYHLPHRSQEFTHRNGRTARMHNDGTAYILKWKDEALPDFIREREVEHLTDAPVPEDSGWRTLIISGGRKDKISKGDIAGLCFKQGKLAKDELGMIELKQDCAFIAVKDSKVNQLIDRIDNKKIKKRKISVNLI